MQIEPYIIISDCHNLFFHTCPFRKIICFRQILYIFCEIVFSFVRKFYYHLPHQFCKSLSGAKQGVKTQLKYVFFLSSMLTNAHFKPFFRLLEIPNTENRHLRSPEYEKSPSFDKGSLSPALTTVCLLTPWYLTLLRFLLPSFFDKAV